MRCIDLFFTDVLLTSLLNLGLRRCGPVSSRSLSAGLPVAAHGPAGRGDSRPSGDVNCTSSPGAQQAQHRVTHLPLLAGWVCAFGYVYLCVSISGFFIKFH